MTDLNDLKQQLYSKIKATQQPEPTPSRSDLLKYSDLRAKQSPTEGAIVPTSSSPFTLADEQYLVEVLTECRNKLDSALVTAKRYSRLPDLATAIADSITGIHQAAAIVIEPETYLE
ncbi:hypothetical protein H6F98_00975 [Microcoleus sp. FACHB-SPT15]|uniref:hypothetical protein n=1 Tax=Microcoleus sp. FACHB-SPT15 TaxID=2692830 RepID=UPI001785FE33|nr:hypothetical protein [Microcoleus sp. FACHB-SPT15]MBD1804047.1 hypothetical protein [Microcoleus sp. FACHB-SPT15]